MSILERTFSSNYKKHPILVNGEMTEKELEYLMLTNLSNNFKAYEFFKSYLAIRHGLVNLPDTREELYEIVSRLSDLCAHVLQPIRDYYNKSIIINSGFRCEELNKLVGSSPKSQHRKGEAADIVIKDVDPYDLSKTINEIIRPNFDQLIYEGTWTHISYTTRYTPRKSVLTAIFEHNRPPRYVVGIIKH